MTAATDTRTLAERRDAVRRMVAERPWLYGAGFAFLDGIVGDALAEIERLTPDHAAHVEGWPE